MKHITVILTAVLATQLALALTLMFTGNDHAAFKAQEPLLASDAKTIDQIAVDETGASSVTLKKQNGSWVVPALGDFPADGQRVKALLEKLTTSKRDGRSRPPGTQLDWLPVGENLDARGFAVIGGRSPASTRTMRTFVAGS
jgi:hypothetical protein